MEVDPTASFAPPPAARPHELAHGAIDGDLPITPEELDHWATLTGKLLDHRYQVGRRLGEGGMSYVYRAQDVENGTAVAVKILLPRLSRDPAAVERLRREATIATRLSHPNVCPILRMGEADRMIYLVMPYLEGEPLSEHETRRGPFPLTEAIPLLVQMCQGLQHAHDLQVVHRDLKPENVMLVPDGASDTGEPRYQAVVMDFGLAKERRAGPEVAKLTATGIVLGTPEFMSPEQIRGKPLDARSDIYALGIVAFEMFTGKLPFTGRNAQEMMIARLRGQPTPIRQLRADTPPAVEKALTKALQTNPDDRYMTAIEFAEALTGGGGESSGGGLFGKLREKFK